MKSILLNLLALVCLTGCSLFFEAADITHRRSKALPEGGVVIGDRFSVRAPAGGLYPTQNIPTSGGVTLRPTEPAFDGYVYFVTPFSSPSAQTADQAFDEWNRRPGFQGVQVNVIERKSTTVFGKNATRAVVDVVQGSIGQIAAMVVVKRQNDFLILARGDRYYTPLRRDHTIELCKTGLHKLIQSTSLTDR
ncbi:MAG: hypothetical protein ACKVY0_02595 [Prosthecobacter sp.]|uniref:hypothetical protein n=1 Tax=Prosthecobacter sp. TaxID=1965333 RepID=UPI003901C9B1